MTGNVKVCGERGLVTFCPTCGDYEPFRLLNPAGARCETCVKRLPTLFRVSPVAPDWTPSADELDSEAAAHERGGRHMIAKLMREKAVRLRAEERKRSES